MIWTENDDVIGVDRPAVFSRDDMGVFYVSIKPTYHASPPINIPLIFLDCAEKPAPCGVQGSPPCGAFARAKYLLCASEVRVAATDHSPARLARFFNSPYLGGYLAFTRAVKIPVDKQEMRAVSTKYPTIVTSLLGWYVSLPVGIFAALTSLSSCVPSFHSVRIGCIKFISSKGGTAFGRACLRLTSVRRTANGAHFKGNPATPRRAVRSKSGYALPALVPARKTRAAARPRAILASPSLYSRGVYAEFLSAKLAFLSGWHPRWIAQTAGAENGAVAKNAHI